MSMKYVDNKMTASDGHFAYMKVLPLILASCAEHGTLPIRSAKTTYTISISVKKIRIATDQCPCRRGVRLRPFFDERDSLDHLLFHDDFVVVIHHGDLASHPTVYHLTKVYTVVVWGVTSTARTLPFRFHGTSSVSVRAVVA